MALFQQIEHLEIMYILLVNQMFPALPNQQVQLRSSLGYYCSIPSLELLAAHTEVLSVTIPYRYCWYFSRWS